MGGVNRVGAESDLDGEEESLCAFAAARVGWRNVVGSTTQATL